MNLEELENLKNLNELDLLYEIRKMAQDNYEDAEVVLKQRRWKTSGIRLRDKMQDIKLITEIIRDKIQLRKGVKWGSKRKLALDKAIEEEIKRVEREGKKNEIRKQKRIAKANK